MTAVLWILTAVLYIAGIVLGVHWGIWKGYAEVSPNASPESKERARLILVDSRWYALFTCICLAAAIVLTIALI